MYIKDIMFLCIELLYVIFLPFLNHFSFLQNPKRVWPNFLSMYKRYLLSRILYSQSLLERQTAWELTYVWVNAEVQLKIKKKMIIQITTFRRI